MKTLQIVLMGWEYDRIVSGLKQKPANKVIFISSDPIKTPDKSWGRASTDLAEKIGNSIKPIVDSEILFFNYHNLDDCLNKTINLLEKVVKEYDEININISAGTTLLKASMMLAAQYYPIKLFYIIPAQYTHPGEIITTGARGLVDLPTINLSQLALPKKKQAEILLLLSEEPQSFTTLTKSYAKHKDIKITPDKIKSLKSWLFYYLKKLEQQNLLTTQTKNKELLIALSQTGKFIKLILEHKSKPDLAQTKLKLKSAKKY
ncbi:MAG: DUF6293 family protein [Candidatus Diapherotrites archaeon]|nr:DUF6293 family protein [Candidatus Diapherotrites archaeon]